MVVVFFFWFSSWFRGGECTGINGGMSVFGQHVSNRESGDVSSFFGVRSGDS